MEGEEELPDDEDTSIFIPFPGTTREIKPKPYRGSDPEWKEFIKFSRDKELIANVRSELLTPPSLWQMLTCTR